MFVPLIMPRFYGKGAGERRVFFPHRSARPDGY
jgi:hypothetical protein